MKQTANTMRTAPSAIVPTTPLSATHLRVDIDDLLASIELEQRYENRENTAIEVSYTVALPPQAALLDVQVEIDERILRGRVQARAQAELDYEQALAEGHSAFSIRMVDKALLNIALGNLKPGENLTLRIRMAQWLVWNGERVRLTLPTTIAPRYGQSTLQPADQPSVDMAIEQAFSLKGSVRGLLAQAELASPTHRLGVRASAQGLDFSIEHGFLDRDIVIDLRDQPRPLRVAGSIAADLDAGAAAMISFCALGDAAAQKPLIAELVIDCSGSMAGVSMEQTRQAVRAIVAQLTPADRINVLRFGSTHQWLLRRPQPATLPVLSTLLQAADTLQADLGGTELLPALNAGLDDLARVAEDSASERVLFVISDGEVWNLDTAAFVQRCAAARLRVFAVAVGSAAVEATFAPLTKATGGALERVLPGDAMAQGIARHFARVRCAKLSQLSVRWPAQTAWTQIPTDVFPGDGVRLSAGLIGTIADAPAQLRWIDPAGIVQCIDVPLRWQSTPEAATSTLARMLARDRLDSITDINAATELAVAQQLITEHSAITLVLQRAPGEQLDQLPALRSVPHMLAAGWAGSAVMSEAPRGGSAATSTGQYPVVNAAPAPPRTATPVAPAQRTLRRAAAKLTEFFAPGSELAPESARICATQAAENRVYGDLIALLLPALRARPECIEALRQGRLSLSLLQLALPPALFNDLDALAEQRGLDLESGTFWSGLVGELCELPVGAALRSALGQ